MKLSSRLSVYFLGMLAVVLLGFSLTLYFVVRHDLYHQVDEKLNALLRTLTAAAEVEPESVEWKKTKRDVQVREFLTQDTLVQWMVTNGSGKPIDGYPDQTNAPDYLVNFSTNATDDKPPTQLNDAEGQAWRSMSHRLVSTTGRGIPDPEKRDAETGELYSFDLLVITGSISLREVHANLNRLAGLLIALSVAIWLAIAVIGRWLCARALLPVTQMAHKAREMRATDFDKRMPVSSSRDELHDLATSFNDLLVRLQDSFERQRTFTGDASHQLRTPLAAILGQLEVALRYDRDAEQFKTILLSVHGQAKNLNQIVESMLFLARSDAESTLDNMIDLNLDEWLTDLVDQHPDLGPDANINVKLESDGPFVVQAQAVLLKQLVGNLVDNAIKYSPVDANVDVILARNDGAIQLSVVDQGVGIPSFDLPHIFEPFYRSSLARKTGSQGYGLGLAVVRRIALALGGTMDVESQSGQGSCFRLTLPAVDRAAGEQKLASL